MGKQVTDFFAAVAQSWISYVVMLNIIGGVTMALLQTIKDLLPIRRWYQTRAIENWFKEGTSRACCRFEGPVSAWKAEEDLVSLGADGNRRAFYDLQPEQISAVYVAVMLVVLESASQHPDLLKTTASRAEKADMETVMTPIPEPMTQIYLDSRSRVLHQSQRAIDALEISLDFRWKWIMQLIALAVAGFLAGIALESNTVKISASPVSVLVSAILAGFLAPVAKDLLAVVQQARGA